MRGFIFSILVLMVNGLNAQEKDSSGVKEITIDSQIFQELEVYPSVDKDLWRKHLQENLQKLIEKAFRFFSPKILKMLYWGRKLKNRNFQYFGLKNRI